MLSRALNRQQDARPDPGVDVSAIRRIIGERKAGIEAERAAVLAQYWRETLFEFIGK